VATAPKGARRAGLPQPTRLIGPESGSDEHVLVILVVLELLALVGIRRVFRAAHGG